MNFESMVNSTHDIAMTNKDGRLWRELEEYEYIYCEREIYILRDVKNRKCLIIQARSPKQALEKARKGIVSNWTMVSDNLPPAGVPIIVAHVGYGYGGTSKKIKIAYPVLYRKHFVEDRWIWDNCMEGGEIGPETFKVIAWQLLPSINGLEIPDEE